MQLTNYSAEYIVEQMEDFDEFKRAVRLSPWSNRYSVSNLAILYTAMKREIPRENSGYSGY